MLYYSPNWVNNTFIYLNSMDRVIYNRAVYAPDIFSGYLLEWGDDAALWQAVCTDDNRFSASWVGRTSITASPAAA